MDVILLNNQPVYMYVYTLECFQEIKKNHTSNGASRFVLFKIQITMMWEH